MTQSSQGYHERWQRALQGPRLGIMPWDEDVTMETCVIFESSLKASLYSLASAMPSVSIAAYVSVTILSLSNHISIQYSSTC